MRSHLSQFCQSSEVLKHSDFPNQLSQAGRRCYVARDGALVCLLLALLCVGCASTPRPGDYVQPTIGVMKFENRAGSAMGWDLGDGMRDVLVDRLVRTGRYHVIERPELDSVLKEIKLEHSGMTRSQDRARLGQIKNVKYLIKGTITDFGHVAGQRGFFSNASFGVGGGSTQAAMGMTMYVVDVESGEILCSDRLEESVSASDVNVRGVYKDVAFGGSAFYRTPLGRATARVIDRAVAKLTQTIANERWVPRVASVDGENVILNGGSERALKVGAEFEVLEAGAAISDPDTGDVIAHGADRAVGRIRIEQVHERYSVANIVSGSGAQVQIGQRCRASRAVSFTRGKKGGL